MKKNPAIALTILRLGLAFVFIWFSFSQFSDPQKWISFLPDFVKALPVSAVAFVKMNALFELLAGILLAFGIWTRIAAALLALHLFGIAFTIGFNALGVRDLGLAIATFSLAIGGAGSFSVDERMEMTNVRE